MAGMKMTVDLSAFNVVMDKSPKIMAAATKSALKSTGYAIRADLIKTIDNTNNTTHYF